MTVTSAPGIQLSEPPLTDEQDVRRLVRHQCGPARRTVSTAPSVGAEAEFFPVRVHSDGSTDRALLKETWPLLRTGLGLATHDYSGPVPMPGGGSLSFEPGGQIEFSSAVFASATGLLRQVEEAALRVAEALGPDIRLLAAGRDHWHPLSSVPQQLPMERYKAMAAYFQHRGGVHGPGRIMMRHTCAYQLNFDYGPAMTTARQWLLCSLLAPLAGIMFATSRDSQHRRSRSTAWSELDPTRTGSHLRQASDMDRDPGDLVARSVLDADVLMIRGGDGRLHPGRPGFTFARWLKDGHHTFGRPSVADLKYHLTTLWHDVRARTYLEVRTVDALPLRWSSAPLAFFCGLLYSAESGMAALELLVDQCRRDWDWWRGVRASGLHDERTWRVSNHLWDLALTGLDDLPPAFITPEAAATATDYADRFTRRGRCLADAWGDSIDAALREGPTALTSGRGHGAR